MCTCIHAVSLALNIRFQRVPVTNCIATCIHINFIRIEAHVTLSLLLSSKSWQLWDTVWTPSSC